MSSENIKEVVREKYGEAARGVASGAGSVCCGTSPASSIDGCDPITSDLYGESEAMAVPEAALKASLGCGNPTLLAKLHRVRRSSTWDQVVESMFSCRHGVLAQPGKRSVST